MVVETNLKGTEFTQSTPVSYTENFSKEYDFDVKAIEFIQSFIDHGILHLDGDLVQVSLPFIERYLLASELAHDEDSALAYFSKVDKDFDLGTFDLYCEIGPSERVYARIRDLIEECIKNFDPVAAGGYVLLKEQIAPSNVKNPKRADSLRQQLTTAIEEVRSGKNETKQKQRLLDINERVRARAAAQNRLRENARDELSLPDDVQRLIKSARVLSIAITLLGSGAEHLKAAPKQELSTKIVKLSALLIDQWTAFQKQIDFESIRHELCSEESIDSMRGDDRREDVRRLVSGLIDLMEFSAMADPIRRVTAYLCERARHRVLATSVERAVPGDSMEALNHGTWLADIDSRRGERTLRDALSALPLAPFLRMTMAAHYVSRVYWNHWAEADRLRLLELASDALRPIALSIDKSKLRRSVEKQKKKRLRRRKR